MIIDWCLSSMRALRIKHNMMLEILWVLLRLMPKPVELRYWYGHCPCGASGGRVGCVKRWRSSKASIRRLAPGSVRCPPSSLEPCSAWHIRGAPSSFRCRVGSKWRISTWLWMSVLMRYFGWGLSYECNCIGVTHGHSRL